MLLPQDLIDLLLKYEHTFLTGVPDSVFKDFINVANRDERFNHVITNNEGESCALAAGYHLATEKVPAVYMQNSGLGNAINPLTSLLDEYIYSIPCLLLIGWRAVPGEKDEPQHKRMGEITPGLLALMNIPYAIVDADLKVMDSIFKTAQKHFQTRRSPFAILFPRKTFGEEKSPKEKNIPESAVLRESALEWMVKQSSDDTVFITTTGKTSRELYEIRERLGHDHAADFLTVGSMGCAATIALGVAMHAPERRVVLIDGDGACLMRMEALATIGYIQPKNLLHVMVDNNAYESTGSQETLSGYVDLPAIAQACRYHNVTRAETLAEFEKAYASFVDGPHMIWLKAFPYSRPELGRPKSTPMENKVAFMQQLQATVCKP